MKKEVKILDADHNPLKIGDKVLVDAKSKKRITTKVIIGGKGKKTIRSVQAPTWFGGAMKTALSPIETRLDRLETRLTKVETTLNEHGERIGKLENVLEKQGEAIVNLDSKLTNVITLNNLKS